MNAETLTFPTIDQTAVKPYPAEARPDEPLNFKPRALATLTDTALAPLKAIEQDLRALAERYRDVAYDLKTPKGLAAMKAARHDLRENGRYLVQRAVQKCKDDANAAKKAVEQEAVLLVAITAARETEFDDTEPLDDEHDGWQNIRERDPIPMREGDAINPNDNWPFPTGNLGY